MNKNPLTKRLAVLGIVLAASGGPVFSAPAAEPRVALAGHIPAQLRNAVLVDRVAADETVQLSVMTQLDSDLLSQTFQALYGPQAPAQKHFLSSAEFAERFNLADKRQKIKDFARSQGLTVDSSDDRPESMMVNLSGRADAVEKAFGVRLQHYRSANGALFMANETDPRVPASLQPHIGAVLGLSTVQGLWHSHLRKATSLSAQALLGGSTGPGSGLAPQDIKTIYGLTGTLTGTGQVVALFELDGYTPSDITAYEAQFSLPSITVTPILFGATSNTCGPGCDEVTLDIEMVAALAPGVSQILVYEGPKAQSASSRDVENLYNKIATDNLAKAVSTSWGLDEFDSGSAVAQAEAQIFQRMAIQGQSVYAAAGDCGAYDQQVGGNCVTPAGDFRVDDPASQPYVTGVGGTSLAGTVLSYTETVWDELSSGRPSATGGGVSILWTIPSYQVGVAGLSSQQFRNVPDVALNADPDTSPYSVFVNGGWALIGGTSAGAPLWAAMTALINQQRAAAQKGVFGFANPSLYSLGTSANAATLFNDITSGNNGHFSAGVGYDNTTGLGSFKGSSLIDQASSLETTVVTNGLANVYAFPNPWDRRKNPSKRQITFANLTSGASVKIFTLSGFWIKTLTAASDGNAIWDLTNDSGSLVASGLYFYLASSNGSDAKGTIAIIK